MLGSVETGLGLGTLLSEEGSSASALLTFGAG